MNQQWPLVPLRDVLRLERRWVGIDPVALYTEIGVRSYGKGIFRKPPVTGASLGSKRVLMIGPGDLVLNNVFAWEGAVAVAAKSEEGTIGSHRFVTYTVDRQRSTPEYLKVYFTSGAGLEVLRKVSPGSAGRNRTLNLEQFIGQMIPLPPLEEQRRIVARVTEVKAKIDEAKELRRRVAEETEALMASTISAAVRDYPLDGNLGDVMVGNPRNGWSARCDGSENGTPILSLAAITGFRYRPDQFKRTSEPVQPGAHYWLREGDLLITRSNTPKLVGHVGIYSGRPKPCIYPDLMMRLEVNERLVHRKFVYYVLRSLPVREHIERNAKGTSPTMKKISQAVVTGIPFPSGVERETQQRIVAHLDSVQARVEQIQRHRTEAAVETDALLWTALEQVFKRGL